MKRWKAGKIESRIAVSEGVEVDKKHLAQAMKSVLIICLVFVPFESPIVMSHADWVQIVLPHITPSMIRSLYPYTRPRTILILDTNIFKEELPALSSQRWTVLTSSQIEDSARQNGEANYICLSEFDRRSNSARVVWEGVKARYMKDSRKFIFEVHYIETTYYTLTGDGWKGTGGSFAIFDFLGPKK